MHLYYDKNSQVKSARAELTRDALTVSDTIASFYRRDNDEISRRCRTKGGGSLIAD